MSSVRCLCPNLQAIALAALNEVPERVAEDLKTIKDWLGKQPHINARTDDQWLLNFLRGCKFSLEKVKLKLDAFYTSRTAIPDLFSNRDPFNPRLQRLLKLGLFLPLISQDDPTTPIIFLFRNCMYDTNIDKMEDVFKLMFMIVDILINECDTYVIVGHITAVDQKNINLSHCVIPLTLLEKCFVTYEKTYPLRINKVCFFNTNSYFSIVLGMIKPFLSKKLKNKFIHYSEDNVKGFHKLVPQKLLPNEYGGCAGPIEQIIDAWKEKVESYAAWFEEEEKYGAAESLRPQHFNFNNSFGIDGTFRKLNFD